MNDRLIQKLISFVILTAFIIVTTTSSYAQGFPVAVSPDPEILVSTSPPAYLLESKQNVQTPLDNMNAVTDPQTLVSKPRPVNLSAPMENQQTPPVNMNPVTDPQTLVSKPRPVNLPLPLQNQQPSPVNINAIDTPASNDPQTLVSKPHPATAPQTLVSMPPLANLSMSMRDLHTSLVNINAVDAPALHTVNGRTGIGYLVHSGHGVIIDPSGIIATNTHIIATAQHIYVILNGDKFEATVLYSNQSDLSFIKIDAPYLLDPIPWGDSSQLQTGNPIFALNNPDSDPLDGEVLNLIKDKPSGDVDLLKLKITLKPGDSGGPILDEQGDLLGLIMANDKSDNSLTYAIASDKIQREYLKYQGSA